MAGAGATAALATAIGVAGTRAEATHFARNAAFLRGRAPAVPHPRRFGLLTGPGGPTGPVGPGFDVGVALVLPPHSRDLVVEILPQTPQLVSPATDTLVDAPVGPLGPSRLVTRAANALLRSTDAGPADVFGFRTRTTDTIEGDSILVLPWDVSAVQGITFAALFAFLSTFHGFMFGGIMGSGWACQAAFLKAKVFDPGGQG